MWLSVWLPRTPHSRLAICLWLHFISNYLHICCLGALFLLFFFFFCCRRKNTNTNIIFTSFNLMHGPALKRGCDAGVLKIWPSLLFAFVLHFISLVVASQPASQHLLHLDTTLTSHLPSSTSPLAANKCQSNATNKALKICTQQAR